MSRGISSFYELSPGQYIKWSNEMRWQWSSSSFYSEGSEEPWSCTLLVTGEVERRGDTEVQFECVADCRRHNITEISYSTFEELRDLLSESPFRYSTLHEAVNQHMVVPQSAAPEYDIVEDIWRIHRLIVAGELPSKKKRYG